MLIDGLINSILLCRVLFQLIINSEPLTKSNNSPINLTPEKKKSQKVSPPPPTRPELPPFGPPFHLEFRCPPWGGYGYFLELHNFTLFFDPKQSLAELDFRFTLPPGGHSLVWAIRVCAAEQGMLFKVLSLKQGIQFHY